MKPTKVVSSYPGADTGFHKGGGGAVPGNCSVLKRGIFACTSMTFYEVWGSPKGGGGGS